MAVKFCSEVLKEFEALIHEHGEDGYKDKWIEHEFPTDILQNLRSNNKAKQVDEDD